MKIWKTIFALRLVTIATTLIKKVNDYKKRFVVAYVRENDPH